MFISSSSNEGLDQEGANTPKISEESFEKNSKELWDLVREHSVQLDRVLSLSQHDNSEKPEQDGIQAELIDEDTQMKQVDDEQFFETEERQEAKRKSKKSKKSKEDKHRRDGVSRSGRERQKKKERDPENRREQAESQEITKEHKIEKNQKRSPKPDKKRKQKHSSSKKQEA